eukprot:gene1145-4714_t
MTRWLFEPGRAAVAEAEAGHFGGKAGVRADVTTAGAVVADDGLAAGAAAAHRLTEALLLRQRDDIESLQRHVALLGGGGPSPGGGGGGGGEADTALVARDVAREELAALRAREEARGAAAEADSSEVGRLQAALLDAREGAARDRAAMAAAHSAELGEARREARRATASAEEVSAERASGARRLGELEVALRMARSGAVVAAAASTSREDFMRDEARKWRAEVKAASAAATETAAVLQERSVAVAVLTETVEAVQGGDCAAAHVASLGAQLASLQATAARTSRRLHESQAGLEAATEQAAAASARLEESRRENGALHAQLAASRQADEARAAEDLALSHEVNELRAELVQTQEAAAQAQRGAQQSKAVHLATQAQLASLISRHAAQLAKEREEHAVLARSLHEQALDAAATAPRAAGAAHGAGAGLAAPTREGGAAGHASLAGGAAGPALLPALPPALHGAPVGHLIVPTGGASGAAAARVGAAGAAAAAGHQRDDSPPMQDVRAQLLLGIEEMRLQVQQARASGSEMADALRSIDGLRSLLLLHNEELGKQLRTAELLRAEHTRTRQLLAVMEPAIERHTVEREISAAQVLLLQRQLADRDALRDGAAASRLRASEARADSLASQLERANSRAAALEERLAEATTVAAAGGAAEREEAAPVTESSLEYSLLRAEAEEACLVREAESEERVRAWLESRVLRGVLLEKHEVSEREKALLCELAAGKRELERLSEHLSASERRAELSRVQLAGLKGSARLQQRELKQLRAAAAAAAASEASGGGAALRAEVAAAEARAHTSLARQQAAEECAAAAELAVGEASKLQRGTASWQALLQDAASRRVQQVQEALGSEQQASLVALHARLLQERAAHGRAMRLVQHQASADLQRAREAWALERGRLEEAAEAIGGAAHGGGRRAAVSVLQLHESAQLLAQENQRLHSQVATLQVQLEASSTELAARDAALAGLEGSIAALHASMAHGGGALGEPSAAGAA